MSGPRNPNEAAGVPNRFPSLAPAPFNPPGTALQPSARPAPSPTQFDRSAPSTAVAGSRGSSAGFSEYSATTAEILSRIRAGNSGPTAGTPAFEAKRAEVLQSYVTSDKLPTPPPITNTGRRGRGGRVGTPSQLKTKVEGTFITTVSPMSARGTAPVRGRGRGRGRARGRGGKRKRSESVEEDSEDNDSDVSASYTPLPTKTKSGRNVNKPVVFVPTLPEPSQGTKRRKSTKSLLASQCNICQRGVETYNNQIVFCDMCSSPYHQYCHSPPIDNEVVTVLEKEWLCGTCQVKKQTVVQGTEELRTDAGLSMDDKRAYFSTLPQSKLISLLLNATVRHPELPLFPPNVRELIAELPKPPAQAPYQAQAQSQPQHQPLKPVQKSVQQPQNNSLPNGVSSAIAVSLRPQQAGPGTDSSEPDSAEAQLLNEISRSSHARDANPTSTSHPTDSTSGGQQAQQAGEEYEDGYDTDPPTHYPKSGQGLARTLRSESEDLQWLVDSNFEVFSHHWKGDGSGVGPDAPAVASAEVVEPVNGAAKTAVEMSNMF